MCSTRAAPDLKRALVTGGTGFVGSNLVRRLLKDGHEVALLVRKGHDSWRLADISRRMSWVEASLEEGSGLQALLSDFKPHWVFHLATHGAYSWQRDPLAIMRTNVLGTVNLLESCLLAGFEAFVNAGSSSEYGTKQHPAREDEALAPNSPYAVAKAAATWYCSQAARASGAPIATLRLYSVYGPWEEPRRFIPQLIARGLEGRLPPLANPETARDYVYVDDVCDAFLAVARGAHEPGAVFNVGTGVQTTLREAVDLARGLLRIEVEPGWRSMPDRSWDTTTWVADISRLQALVGRRAPIGLEEGLRRTAEWMRSQPGLKERYRAASS